MLKSKKPLTIWLKGFSSYMPTNWYHKLSCYKKDEIEYKEDTAFTVYMLEFIKKKTVQIVETFLD
jgi:hypothetical protein